MNNVQTGLATTVREINAACRAACYGRGPEVRGLLGPDKTIRITRARTIRDSWHGRTPNGNWFVLTAVSF